MLRAPADPNVACRIGAHDVPERIRSLCMFDAPDYIDSFTVHTRAAPLRSAEGWARAVLEESSLSRRSARRLWQVIGLRLGPPPYSADHVQGWAIAGSGADFVLLETHSWYLSAQAVCLIGDDNVSLSLSLHYDNRAVGRFVWASVEGPHRKAVPVMLQQAVAIVSSSA